MKYTITPELNDKFHFFASSVASWRTRQNLEELLTAMKREKLPFNVFYVPLHKDAEYEIDNYSPQVEGAKFIGYWE